MIRLVAVFCCFVSVSVSALAEVGTQGFCENCAQANAERAEWGLGLRQEMLSTCQGQDFRVCSDPYKNLLIQQEEADNSAREALFRRGQLTASGRDLVTYSDHQKAQAAWMALRGVRPSSDEIVKLLFVQCQQTISAETAVADRAGYSTDRYTPVCQDPLDDVQYLDSCNAVE